MIELLLELFKTSLAKTNWKTSHERILQIFDMFVREIMKRLIEQIRLTWNFLLLQNEYRFGNTFVSFWTFQVFTGIISPIVQSKVHLSHEHLIERLISLSVYTLVENNKFSWNVRSNSSNKMSVKWRIIEFSTQNFSIPRKTLKLINK